MSEDVHYKGKLTPTGKTLKEFDPGAECITDNHYYNAVEIDGQIFTVEKVEISNSECFNSTENEDGTIDFEVKYYNGGCSFNEAIEEALK